MDVGEPPLSSDNMSNCPLQVNLNELDQQMEQIKEMFVKKQEMMKKMSSATAPTPPSSLPRTFPSLASIGRISEIE